MLADYEITLKVSELNTAPTPPEPVTMVQFNSFRSMDVQTLGETDIISISMGNSMDFTTLEDKIIMCPEVLEEGIAAVTKQTCSTVNAVKEVTCESFKVPCPSGEKFFFRLVTPGEVYTLGIDDGAGNIIAAPGGLVDCDVVKSWTNADGEVQMKIVNDHFKNTLGLS